MFCCTLLYVDSSIAIILMGKRELVALLNLSSWCLVMVKRLFLAVPRGCLLFVIVEFPDHTHLLILDGIVKHVSLQFVNLTGLFVCDDTLESFSSLYVSLTYVCDFTTTESRVKNWYQ